MLLSNRVGTVAFSSADLITQKGFDSRLISASVSLDEEILHISHVLWLQYRDARNERIYHEFGLFLFFIQKPSTAFFQFHR